MSSDNSYLLPVIPLPPSLCGLVRVPAHQVVGRTTKNLRDGQELVGSRNVIATLVLRENADAHSELGSDLSLRKVSSGAYGADIPRQLLTEIRSFLLRDVFLSVELNDEQSYVPINRISNISLRKDIFLFTIHLT